MCKIMAFAGIKLDKTSQDLMWEWLFAATPFMIKTDNHGVGFAARTATGLFMEKWLHVDDAWKYRPKWTAKDDEIAASFKDILSGDKKYMTMGCHHNDISAVIFHSRFATCDKTIENTHPFVKDDTALIHNGVINNDHELVKELSTCDSETILQSYLQNKTNEDMSKIGDAIKVLQGYYGCALLTKDADGKAVLDLFRHNAYIYAAYVKQLDTIVFCTSDDIIISTVKALKWEMGNVFKLHEHKLARLDCVTGKIIGVQSFKPAEYKSAMGKWLNRACGD